MSPDERAKVIVQAENQEGASRNDHQTFEIRSTIEPHDLEPVRREFVTRMEPVAKEANEASSHAPKIAQQAGASSDEIDQAKRRAELVKGKCHMLETSNTDTVMKAGPSYAQSVQMPFSPEHARNDDELKAYILQAEQLQRRLATLSIGHPTQSSSILHGGVSTLPCSLRSTFTPNLNSTRISQVHAAPIMSTSFPYTPQGSAQLPSNSMMMSPQSMPPWFTSGAQQFSAPNSYNNSMSPYAPFMFPNFGYNVLVQNPFGLNMPYNQSASTPFFMQSQPFQFGQPAVPSSAQNPAQWNVQSSDRNTFPSVPPVRSTISVSTEAEPVSDISAQPSFPESGHRGSETPI